MLMTAKLISLACVLHTVSKETYLINKKAGTDQSVPAFLFYMELCNKLTFQQINNSQFYYYKAFYVKTDISFA